MLKLLTSFISVEATPCPIIYSKNVSFILSYTGYSEGTVEHAADCWLVCLVNAKLEKSMQNLTETIVGLVGDQFEDAEQH